MCPNIRQTRRTVASCARPAALFVGLAFLGSLMTSIDLGVPVLLQLVTLLLSAEAFAASASISGVCPLQPLFLRPGTSTSTGRIISKPLSRRVSVSFVSVEVRETSGEFNRFSAKHHMVYDATFLQHVRALDCGSDSPVNGSIELKCNV